VTGAEMGRQGFSRARKIVQLKPQNKVGGSDVRDGQANEYREKNKGNQGWGGN